MIPIFDSKRQYAQIGEEAEKAVCEVMRSGCYILGPNVKALEKEFPELVSKESLTQKVGGHVKEGFKEVVHEVPLLSLQDIFSFEELYDFDERVRKVAEEENQELKYVVETKIDGLSTSLRYENGEFVQGATRGNGRVGEDARRIK